MQSTTVTQIYGTAVICAAFMLGTAAATATAADAPGTLIEIVEVRANHPRPVKTREILRAGQWYVIEASGTFSEWRGETEGHDAIWCYHNAHCGPGQRRSDSLLINGVGMTRRHGKAIPYTPSHRYRIRFQGKGKRISLFLKEATMRYMNNSGTVVVRIYKEGRRTAAPPPGDVQPREPRREPTDGWRPRKSDEEAPDRARRRLIETLRVPSTSQQPVHSRTRLLRGRRYLIEAEGTFSTWRNRRAGVDAVWCYARKRCGGDRKAWNALRLNGRGMSGVAGRTLKFNREHLYRVRVTGDGRRMRFVIRDPQKNRDNNTGTLIVRIYALGSHPGAGSASPPSPGDTTPGGGTAHGDGDGKPSDAGRDAEQCSGQGKARDLAQCKEHKPGSGKGHVPTHPDDDETPGHKKGKGKGQGKGKGKGRD